RHIPFSSHEPFKESVHFHANWLAALLEGNEVKNVDRDFDEYDLWAFSIEWAIEAKKEAIKQCLVGAKDMPDELNVKIRWVPALYNLAEFGQARLRMWYDERSQVEDLEDCVKAVDAKRELILMRFQRDKYDYFALWSFDDYIEVEDRLIKVKGRACQGQEFLLRIFRRSLPLRQGENGAYDTSENYSLCWNAKERLKGSLTVCILETQGMKPRPPGTLSKM
ncbi:unnamed protein product, partial [marine sediment metagenome]